MYAWRIGCATHGVSAEMLSSVKDALHLMNEITCRGSINDDHYQAPDFACTFTEDFTDLYPYEGKESIWLVTTGYKIRPDHARAIDTLIACNLPRPAEICYTRAKRAAGDVKYTCNSIHNTQSGWGRLTRRGVDAAWATLEGEAVDTQVSRVGTACGCGTAV